VALPSGEKELEGVARAFLAALDERRWHDAAVLVDSQTLERFRAWSIKLLDLRSHQPAQPGESDTFFIPATALMGVADAATAKRLSATQLLARVAENVHPENVLRHHKLGQSEEIRITRTLVGVERASGNRATARYQTEWWHGDSRNEATAGVHTLDLVQTSTGWRIRDADLSGHGGGHILPADGWWDVR
jgi:hypothetical protein